MNSNRYKKLTCAIVLALAAASPIGTVNAAPEDNPAEVERELTAEEREADDVQTTTDAYAARVEAEERAARERAAAEAQRNREAREKAAAEQRIREQETKERAAAEAAAVDLDKLSPEEREEAEVRRATTAYAAANDAVSEPPEEREAAPSGAAADTGAAPTPAPEPEPDWANMTPEEREAEEVRRATAAYAAKLDAEEAAERAAEPDAQDKPQPVPEKPAGPYKAPADSPNLISAIPPKETNLERAEKWSASRPADDDVYKDIRSLEGKTVVAIELEGATDETFETAKAVINMHTGDEFTVSELESDRQTLYDTGYYYDLYPSFEVVPEGVIVTYHVLENPHLKSLTITGNTVEPNDTLYNLITVKEGEILNSRHLHEDVEAIQAKYKDDGYVMAKIGDLNIDREGNLSIRINEGILEGYKVSGNTKTKDRVILREMRQKTGEPFNAKLARRSMQRVYNLGFFEDVNMKLNPGVEPNAVELEIAVKEKRTGSFGLGAGYSSSDGFIGMVHIGDSNFRGTGDAISLTVEHSGDDEDAHGISFSYRRPWIDKRETAATIRLYNRTYEYDDYDTNGDEIEEYMRKYAGGEITVSRPVSEYSTNFLTLRNRRDTYKKHKHYLDRSVPAYDDWRNYNFGTTRSITLEHVTDTRDNVYNPTSGGRVNLSGEVAGMGGDFDYQKISAEDQRFFKVGHAQVIAARLKYGFGHGHIPESAQYKVGGQDTLRGYRDEQFRGNRMLLATLEYRFPLISKVQGAIFTDWGQAWDDGFMPDDFHGSAGVGLSLDTPLGPLRLDYGRGSQGGRVHFRVGGSF